MRREHDENGPGGAQRFRMRQKLVSIGDDFWIEDEAGRRVYKVDGKAMRIRDTLVLEDADGHALLKIQQKLARLRKTMTIEDPGGRTVATVKKARLTPLHDRWVVDVEHGPGMEVTGNIIDHEYTVVQGDRQVAVVSKRWLRVTDTYTVDVLTGEDPALVLAVVAVVDHLAHDD
jgi:uncharacterized protein YxjI